MVTGGLACSSLFKITTLAPMLNCFIVESSVKVILKEASPSISITKASGHATLAPMAAKSRVSIDIEVEHALESNEPGKPKPMVPRPPDEIIDRGCRHWKC